MILSQLLFWFGAVVAGLQYAYACAVDEVLPARAKLPFWGRHGPDMIDRAAALYIYVWLQAGLTVMVVLTTAFDQTPGAQDITIGRLAIFGAIYALLPLTHMIEMARLIRWAREGERQFERPAIYKILHQPKLIIGFVALCFVVGFYAA